MEGTRKTSRVSVFGVLAISLLLAGCSASGGSDTEASGQGPDSSSSSSATSSAQNASSDETGKAAQASAAPAQELDDLGTRKGGKGKDSTITLNSVTANDGTMTVNFSLNNTSDSSKIQVAQMFSDGIKDKGKDGKPTAVSADTFSADGVFVTTSEQKRYLVGRGDDGACACSSNLAAANIDAGQTMTFSAVFAAPPEEIDSVDIHIPTAGTFENVSLVRQ